MKHQWHIFSFLGLISLAACNTTEQIGANLDPSEIGYVGNASFNKCIADSQANLDDLIAESNASLDTFIPKSTNWTYTWKRNGTDVTGYILFWKNAAPNYYFAVVTTFDGTNLSRFYKVTKTTNADMFKDLQEKKCRRVTNLTSGISKTTASMTMDYDPVPSPTDSNLRTDTSIVYNYKASLPALFGYLASKRTVKTLNSSNTVTKTETYEYTITANSTIPTPPGDGSLSAYPGRDYRMIRFTPEVPPVTPGERGTPASYSYPYDDPSSTNDATTISADGGTTTFAPSTEL